MPNLNNWLEKKKHVREVAQRKVTQIQTQKRHQRKNPIRLELVMLEEMQYSRECISVDAVKNMLITK